MLNVPPVVTLLLGAMVVVHAIRALVLGPDADVQILLLFSFIPARYDAAVSATAPGGWGAEIWTFFTYAFLHGDLTHLTVNGVWLLAFGSAVARRFGALRALIFFLVTAAAGAAAHLVTHPSDYAPVVGASASISGFMAAAIRFVFQTGGPLGVFRAGSRGAYLAPAAALSVTLRDPRVLAFLAVWFGLNILFGLGSLSLTDEQQSVAWQAHIGGFVAGLLLFPLFDPVRARGDPRDQVETARR